MSAGRPKTVESSAGPASPGWSRGQQQLMIAYAECVQRMPQALHAEGYRVDAARGARTQRQLDDRDDRLRRVSRSAAERGADPSTGRDDRGSGLRPLRSRAEGGRHRRFPRERADVEARSSSGRLGFEPRVHRDVGRSKSSPARCTTTATTTARSRCSPGARRRGDAGGHFDHQPEPLCERLRRRHR